MKKLSWNDLANIYDKEVSGCRARTLSMDKIFNWAERQIDKFVVNIDGSISEIIKES